MTRWGLVLAGACACAPDRGLTPIDDCVVPMDEVIYDHACQHGRRGPFQAVTAQASAADAPTVSVGQRVLTIAMPPASGARLGYLRYRPTRDGAHAAFSGADGEGVAVRAADPDGAPVRAVTVVPPSQDCGALRWITGFELAVGVDYLLTIGPTDAAEVRIFIEHLGTFGAPGWEEQCAP